MEIVITFEIYWKENNPGVGVGGRDHWGNTMHYVVYKKTRVCVCWGERSAGRNIKYSVWSPKCAQISYFSSNFPHIRKIIDYNISLYFTKRKTHTSCRVLLYGLCNILKNDLKEVIMITNIFKINFIYL